MIKEKLAKIRKGELTAQENIKGFLKTIKQNFEPNFRQIDP